MAASTPKRVCWDACAWIALIQREKIRDAKGAVIEDRYGLCRSVIDLAEKGKIEVATSGLSLAEVCKSPAIKARSDDQIGPYFEHDWVLVVPVDTLVGATARALMLAGHAGLKPPDAVHLATAIIANADELHTFDKRLLDLDEQLARQDGNILKICKPSVATAPAPLLESSAQANKGDQDADDATKVEADESAGVDGEPVGAVPKDGGGTWLQPEPDRVRNDSAEAGAGENDAEDEAEEGDDEEGLNRESLPPLTKSPDTEKAGNAGSNPVPPTSGGGSSSG